MRMSDELSEALKQFKPCLRKGGDPVDEVEHFMNCGACGQSFDMRDLSEVFYHEELDHKPRPRS